MNLPAASNCRQLSALWCASVLCAATFASGPPDLPHVLNLAPVTPKIVGLTLRDREVRAVPRQP